MEIRNIQKSADQFYEKYRDYMDFFESKSVLSKVKGGLSAEDIYAFGKQLENYQSYQDFNETNGGQSDMGLLPQIALDKKFKKIAG